MSTIILPSQNPVIGYGKGGELLFARYSWKLFGTGAISGDIVKPSDIDLSRIPDGVGGYLPRPKRAVMRHRSATSTDTRQMNAGTGGPIMFGRIGTSVHAFIFSTASQNHFSADADLFDDFVVPQITFATAPSSSSDQLDLAFLF